MHVNDRKNSEKEESKSKILRKDACIKKWFSDLDCEKSTEDGYLQGIQAYTEFTGMTPQELINEAKAEEKADIDMSDRKIRDHLNDFRQELRDKDLADTTVRARLAAVKSFYQSYYVDLPRTKREKHRARVLEENKVIPTREDLRDVLRAADPLEKAVLLVGISSGLSLNEIKSLRIKDFKKGYDPETGITTLDMRRGKTDVDFFTFLTPEASQAVIDYLDFRGRESKINTPRRKDQLEKQRVVSDSGYLFILRNIPKEYLTSKKENLRQLTPVAISKIYRSLSEKAQKNSEKGYYNVIRSHNMRKYFNSALLNAGADSFHVEYWMGHTIDNTKAAYFRASPDKQREIYSKYMPYLTIQKELAVADTQAYQDVVADRDKYKAEAYVNAIDRVESEYWMSTHQKLIQSQDEKIKDQEDRIKQLEWLIEFSDKPQKIAEDHFIRMKEDPEYKKRVEKM